MILKEFQTENLNVMGNPAAPVVVVCDAPSEEVFSRDMCLSVPAMNVFARHAQECGFAERDFVFVTASAPIPENCLGSERRITDYTGQFREELLGCLHRFAQAKCLLFLGGTAGRQLLGRPVKITKERGMAKRVGTWPFPLVGMLSPGNVLNRPEVEETFAADFRQVAKLRDNGWDLDQANASTGIGRECYEWCTNLEFLLDQPPQQGLSADTETTGLLWQAGDKPLVVSLAYQEDHALVLPMDRSYYPEISEKCLARLKRQLRQLLGNKAIAVMGHNLKFDLHMLRHLDISVGWWWLDTLQLAFALDENMQAKNIDDCVKRWYPEKAGYNDAFNQRLDKSRMLEVAHEDMLAYAGGDVAVHYGLARRMVALAKEDARQWKTFTHIQMPALRTFVDMEREGVNIDVQELRSLEESLGLQETEEYNKLIAEVPGAIKRRHLAEGKELSFTRDDFTRDILFGADGLRLVPLVFTESTRRLPPEQRVPSVSTKDHLPYFSETNDFVFDLIAYQKLQKLRSTYVGKEPVAEVREVALLKNGRLPKRVADLVARHGVDLEAKTLHGVRLRSRPYTLPVGEDVVDITHRFQLEPKRALLLSSEHRLFEESYTDPTGFWQYLYKGKIHPSYLLDRTVTGRAASRSPNGQNFPKRGPLAVRYRRIFTARPGDVLLEADLSQAEIRIAACMANERVMLDIYNREGGDVHSATAAATMHVTDVQFAAGMEDKTPLAEVAGRWPGAPEYLRKFSAAERAKVPVSKFCDFKRFQAKAINFGFLYGMGWRKFMAYAKTDYGLTLSEREAQDFRDTFFRKYPALKNWHASMREFVNANGYVRSLHGALRRLPSIYSDDEGIRSEAERQGINSPVQRMASDLGLIALANFNENCPHELVRPLMFIHDAVVISAREDMAQEAAAGIRWHMENPPLWEWFNLQLPLPIVADVSQGTNLGNMEKIHVEAAKPSWTE